MTMLKHGRVLLLSLDNLPTNLHSLLYVAILLTTIPQLGMVACHDLYNHVATYTQYPVTQRFYGTAWDAPREVLINIQRELKQLER